MIDKHHLSERDICTKFITPAIEQAGWDRLTHFLEEVYFTEGRIYVRGRSDLRVMALSGNILKHRVQGGVIE